MLVVTRNTHESVVVGEDKGLQRLMKVTVLSVLGRQVKLGFDIQDEPSASLPWPSISAASWSRNRIIRSHWPMPWESKHPMPLPP